MNGKQVWLVLLGCVIVLAAVTAFAVTRPYSYNGTLIEPAMPAPAIDLPTAQGGEFHLSDEKGKAVVIFFGYTTCPDVCPTTLAEMKRVREELKGKEDQVDFLFVTVDPQRDTPEKIQQYASGFHPSFLGLSGSEEQLTPIWESYGIFRQIRNEGSQVGYLVDHTSRTYVVDPQGNLRLTYPFGMQPEEVAEDVRQLLKDGR